MLKRLDVTPEQLATVPQITPLLEQADGGMKQVIAAMRLSRDTAIRTFLEKYDSIPNDSRMRVPVEGPVR